jgi:putative flippase GtrA
VIRQFKSKQFLAFLLTGGFAALVNFSSRILYSRWVDFSSAIIAAYVTGMVTAFILARLFVFRKTKRALHHSAVYFVLVNVIAVAQTWGISIGLVYYVFPELNLQSYPNEIAHAIGVVVPVFTSYLGHKHLSFR